MGSKKKGRKGGYHETCEKKEIIAVCTKCPFVKCNPDSCDRIKNAQRKIKERERLKKEVKRIVKKAFTEYKQTADNGTEMVEKVLEHYRFEPDKVKMIRLYFLDGQSVNYVCIAVGISRSTFFYWMNEILDLSLRWAKELKLI